jgi:hypothetical protein
LHSLEKSGKEPFGKASMWEVVILVLQIAGLAILVAAAIVSVTVPDWVKRRFKGPNWG